MHAGHQLLWRASRRSAWQLGGACAPCQLGWFRAETPQSSGALHLEADCIHKRCLAQQTALPFTLPGRRGNCPPPADAQGLSQSVMVDLRMELLAPYAELRPERDPPRVRSSVFDRELIISLACWRPTLHPTDGRAMLASSLPLPVWLCWKCNICHLQTYAAPAAHRSDAQHTSSWQHLFVEVYTASAATLTAVCCPRERRRRTSSGC